jgi:hypothetical protein
MTSTTFDVRAALDAASPGVAVERAAVRGIENL